MRKLFGIFKGYVTIIIITVFILGISVLMSALYQPVYQTEDISEYLNITGNYDNKTPAQFVSSFFPKEIEQSFSDIDYHYYAKKLDTYSFEMVLEFTIQDIEHYNSYKSFFLNQESVLGKCANTEQIPADFSSYVIADTMVLTQRKDDYSVENANWGRILCSDALQQFVFVAIGVCDGGGSRISEFSYFFDRFNLDPTSFASHIYK